MKLPLKNKLSKLIILILVSSFSLGFVEFAYAADFCNTEDSCCCADHKISYPSVSETADECGCSIKESAAYPPQQAITKSIQSTQYTTALISFKEQDNKPLSKLFSSHNYISLIHIKDISITYSNLRV